MNQVNFVGRLVNDNNLKHFQSGRRVVNNSIAVTTIVGKSREKRTDYIPFSAWNGLADILCNYTGKGHQVAISGRMQSSRYEDENGKTNYPLECVVQTITLLSGRPRSEESDEVASEPENQEVFGAGDPPEVDPEEVGQIAQNQS